MKERPPRIQQMGQLVAVAVFPEHPVAFRAMSDARWWLDSRDMEICSTQSGKPTAIIYAGSWAFGSSKWENIAPECFASLPGVLIGERRHGPLSVLLRRDVAASLGLAEVL